MKGNPMRYKFIYFSFLAPLSLGILSLFSSIFVWLQIPLLGLIGVGYYDYFQTKHTIRRNFPLLGRVRFLFEAIRPEIQQYFIEQNREGRPFSRETRSVIYQRAKGVLDTLPFGTQMNLEEEGYEFLTHSLLPVHVASETLRVQVGGKDCLHPYSASLLNISAMSFGALSKNAVMALNGGAKMDGFAQNTGEGGLTEYHLGPGGDVIWQLGSAYFGCRTSEGRFDSELFKQKAQHPQVKMIELKISQGAMPSYGGILPAKKVTREIAKIRGVPLGQDVVSPPAHPEFSTPLEMIYFIKKLRDLSGGKPIGFKISIGRKRQFIAICKAMIQTGICPDYIAVDGSEGGTGAAPLDFSNRMGTPLMDALIFVHNCLTGFGLRNEIKLIASGRATTGFDLVRLLCAGADMVSSARAFMMSIGCVQALKCNANTCPTGVATQDPELCAGLDPADKSVRAARFHKETLKSVAELVGALGVEHTCHLKPYHLKRRTAMAEFKTYNEIYTYIEPQSLLNVPYPAGFENIMSGSTAESFKHVDDL
jgi:glutamate synthase domain-containing protein 2